MTGVPRPTTTAAEVPVSEPSVAVTVCDPIALKVTATVTAPDEKVTGLTGLKAAPLSVLVSVAGPT